MSGSGPCWEPPAVFSSGATWGGSLPLPSSAIGSKSMMTPLNGTALPPCSILRLVYFPFTAMNFGMGLTKVNFRDYLWGTGLGILVGTFIFTFFIGTVKEVWATGQWANLLSGKVFFSLGLFVFSLFIPKIINKLKIWQGVKTA